MLVGMAPFQQTVHVKAMRAREEVELAAEQEVGAVLATLDRGNAEAALLHTVQFVGDAICGFRQGDHIHLQILYLALALLQRAVNLLLEQVKFREFRQEGQQIINLKVAPRSLQ